MKHLIRLHVGSINANLVRRLFEEFPYLSWLEFDYQNQVAVVTERKDHQKRFIVVLQVGFEIKRVEVLGLEAVIRLLVETSVNAAI